MGNKTRKRVAAIIINDSKILLIKRVKPNIEYYTFPGGGIENNETFEQTLKREVKEELSLEISEWKPLFEINHDLEDLTGKLPKIDQQEYFFLINKYSGNPEIGGPEKERMSENNQYHIVWLKMNELKQFDNIYPQEAVKKLLEWYEKTN
jgi:8-oxo-dGTP diphosphatase